MKKIALTAITIAALTAGAAVHAQVQPVVYISGNVNYTNVSNLPVKFSDYGAGTRAGVQLNKNLAAELGYDDFGKDKSGAVSAKIKGLTLAGVSRTEVAPNTWVRGSLGMIRTKAKIVAGPQQIKRYESEPFVGLGVEQVIDKNLSALAEFRYAKINDSHSRNLNMGVKYTF